MKKILNFIDGQYVEPLQGSYFPNINPATGKVIGQVAEGSPEDIDRAVEAARRAFKGPWGQMSLNARLDALERVASGILARFDEFLRAEMLDTGKPASFASRIDIPRGAANFRFFANLMRGQHSAAFETDTPDGRGALNYTIRRPLGVVGVISPWNLPLLLLTWKVAPALAAGNCVVAKPSEETPSTAALLGEVFNEAGIPPGVFNVVQGAGPGSAGEALTRHPDIDAITFTGESRTGSAIMEACAPHVRNISFELGGKNAAIVFADANLQEAIDGTARSTFSNTGQVCLCSERVYVQRPIFEEFVAGLAARARGLRVGDPFDEATQMGPLISQAHRDKVLSYFELARSEGAEVITGGGIPELGGALKEGAFVEPTIWTGLAPDARTVREEVFGPVCHIHPFDTEEEAVALANDSDYGLCAAIWTHDLRRAHRVAARMDVGLVWVNTWFLRDLRTPFGGVKLSGIGREGGTHSLDFYTETRNICIKL
ncbi:2-hydroxymuconic semialdehyde dehydrogenase [Lujinxingia litoralis]|uniref:2-hydroxymuconic semialdehyde dehydrogenase n=1 Tax=Lujinxingia litoralis TaxID=2211119 RepID=A0A328CA69_9DELT|nr:2-hydroxymuconic semialdehyde dehydrogenase [Lujinxingia litoralis]RAL22137.1 2-hydroxymuconic semialdehyde dehydrogenase [Lujinxingia litoralis]